MPCCHRYMYYRARLPRCQVTVASIPFVVAYSNYVFTSALCESLSVHSIFIYNILITHDGLIFTPFLSAPRLFMGCTLDNVQHETLCGYSGVITLMTTVGLNSWYNKDTALYDRGHDIVSHQ